jgi:hypothetical protein
VSRRDLITTSAALALAVSAPALANSSSGDAGPRFARAYVGTVTGALRTNGRIDTWRVRGLTFMLQSARFARGRWGGTYLVTGGRVSFATRAGATCQATSGSFSLGRLSWEAAAISFLQNLRSPGYAYQARVSKEHPVSGKPCAGVVGEQDAVSPAGGLWLMTDIGERLVPGKRLSGRFTDSSDRGTRTWTWNLAPAR